MYGLTDEVIQWVVARQGSLHPWRTLRGERCALVVVDMQNYFVKPGFQAEVPAARDIVPAINRAARSLRAHRGTVVWIQTAADGADASWSWLHHHLYAPERSQRRLAELSTGTEGFSLWAELEVLPEDMRVVKSRFSAFIQGSSGLERALRERRIDTVLVAGTATNICCSTTAQDAMMLNFQTSMLADANAAPTEALHLESLRNFMMFFGDVMNVAEMEAMLAANADD
jgi:ureidoacrylate peracid hydrolase